MSGISGLFESRARETPDRPALVTDDATIAYGELEGRANRLARHLLTTGLTAGETVAVVTERLPDVMVAMLAALKAGGAYAVIDPHEPMDELGRLLAAARSRVVVTLQELRPRVDDGSGRRVLCLDSEADAIAAHPPEPPDAPSGATAAVLFTAGTTGPRRAVDVGHARLRAAYEAWAEVFRLDPGDRHLITAAPDIAAFTGGWVRALCSGATLVHAGPGDGKPPLTEGVTVLDTDPATAAALLEKRPPGSLRLVAVSGERLTLGEQARLQNQLVPGARLINMYGTAEVAGCGTWFDTAQLAGPVREPERLSLLGRPFPGVKVELHRNEIRLTPPEGGDALSTGDQGRLRDDGLLEFRGRRAHRITVRGRRVSLYEAEAVLAAHPEIREAVIVCPDGGVRLVAYVVPRGSAAPGVDAVREHLRGKVPERQIPERVVTLDSLPRNRAGRVDRRVLPLPSSAAPLRNTGKGGLSLTRAEWSAALRGLVTFLSLPAALVLTGVLWPGSTDVTGVPQPWRDLFVGLYIIEVVAFVAGVGFLLFGRAPMLRQGRSPALTTAAHLAIVWLLASWWPQDNFYRLAAKTDWPRQAALVYTFNVTLVIAAVIVAVYATRPPRAPT